MTQNEISHYESLKKQDTANRKLIKKLQLDKQALKEQLILSGVSGMFSEKQMEEAWTNGCGCGETRSGYFDIENYS